MKTYKILFSFYLILISGIGFSQSVPSYVPTIGLNGWWGFNGDAHDGSGNGNHGTVNGATLTTDRHGNPNGAYNFDGVDDHIALLNPFNNGQNLPEFTISAWINSISSHNGTIWGKSGYWKEVVLSYSSSNQFTFLYAYPSRNYYGIYPTSQLQPNSWHHLVIKLEFGNLYAYLNGVLIGTSPTNGYVDWAQDNGGCSTGQNFIGLGRYCQVYNHNPFNGKLDDIGIWNRALTPQEITNLYNSQLPTQTSLCLPTITTTSPSSVGVDTVVIGGDISNDGGSSIVLRGICYSTSPNPNMGNQRTEDGSGIGTYSAVLRGLTSSTTYYARSYAKNFNGVVVYGNEVSFTTSASLPGVRCPGTPTVTDIDGNIYNTVQIGNQCWTQSNLKVSKYRNGDSIPTGLSDNTWQNTTSGAYAIYNNDPVNDGLYGKLYNHYAVTDSRGLCPTGWHVPTDGEWNVLVQYLDPNADTVCVNCSQSSIVVGLLKSSATQPTPGGWNTPNTGSTNSSGFTALPGALRVYSGGFNGMFSGYWWTSSVSSGSVTWYRDIITNSSSLRRNVDDRSYGFSVRCLKD